MTETPDEKDELIARLATENANLQSLAPALTLANRAIEQVAQQRDALEAENEKLKAELEETKRVADVRSEWLKEFDAQEPVAWDFRSFNGVNTSAPGWGKWERVEPRNIHVDDVANKVAELQHYIAAGYRYQLRALYTHPQPELVPQPERKPMSDAEITEAIYSTDRYWHSDTVNDEWAARFARAIEAHHNIKEAT